MSTKSTIILSNANEHWYTDCGEMVKCTDFEFRDKLYIEIGREHVIEDCGEDGFCIEVNPNSELYKAFEEKNLITNQIPRKL